METKASFLRRYKAELAEQRQSNISAIIAATGDQEIYVIKGRLGQLEDLLSLLDEEIEKEKKEDNA